MARILAIDTSAQNCSVAIIENNQIIADIIYNEKSRQAEILFSLIQQIFSKTNLSYNKIDALAVTLGPGSFTGLRVGIASARGICLASDKPLIGVTTFEAMAICDEAYKKHEINVILDAKRKSLYWQSFKKNGLPKSDAKMIKDNQLPLIIDSKNNYFVGNASDIIEQLLNKDLISSNHFRKIDAKNIAIVANQKFKEFGKTGKFETSPLYIRLPDAVIPKN